MTDIVQYKQGKPALPASYLAVQFKQQLTISQVQHLSHKPLAVSPISQTLFLKIVKEVIKRQNSELLQNSIQNIIDMSFQKGDSQKADLLVEDIFGADNCAIIGLPAKLIAASLGKMAKQPQPCSNYWDHLNSLLNALAINTGLLVREWILITKVDKVVMRTSIKWTNHMLYTLRTLIGIDTEIFVNVENQQSFSILPKQMHW